MTETAAAATKSKKKAVAERKERKPRASNAAVAFAQKIEAAASEKINKAAQEMASAVAVAAQNGAVADLFGEDIAEGMTDALLTVALGARLGVSKHGIAAARNKIHPIVAGKMLANLGVE